jgi:hypothetical protein
MRLVFKPYLRRDGTAMFFLNNDRKVSVGCSPGAEYCPSTKLTAGQKNLINAAVRAFADSALPFTGSVEAHAEGKSVCGRWTLLLTDVGSVGGMAVESDGAYLVRDGKILRCGEWIETAE